MKRTETQAEAALGALSPARYAQVKDHVVRLIQRGDWPVGHRLPSENELVAELGISRMTVNRALRELVAEKLVVRVQGVGTYVAENKPQSTLVQIGVISAEIRARGHAYRCQMLATESLSAPPDVGFWLELAPSDPVFHTLCLHFENGVPVQLEDRYVNARAVPNFLGQDFSVEPPGEYLTRNVPFDQVEHVVDAVLPTAQQALHLQMAESEPCLLLTRRTWMQDKVVTMVRCLHPASRYRLGSRFRPSGTVQAG